MKPVPRHNVTREQPVEAIVQAVAEPFLYYLKSVENPPYIRFTVPGDKLLSVFHAKPLITFGPAVRHIAFTASYGYFKAYYLQNCFFFFWCVTILQHHISL